jgi:NADH:ubiquinone oxidoreductase subunit 5 (subunit L)/multisubunit Na+/H+ antiporter MnhA subunit
VTVLLLLHLVVGLALVSAARPAATRPAAAFLLAAVPLGATVVWLAVRLPDIVDGDVFTSHVSWIPTLGVDLDLRLDGFAALMLVLVAGIGVLVVAYAWCYLSHPEPPDIRLVGLLVLFARAMLGLVLADNLFVLYGFWELTSVTSFLLIGNRAGAFARSGLARLTLTRTARPGRPRCRPCSSPGSAPWRCWPGSSSSASTRSSRCGSPCAGARARMRPTSRRKRAPWLMLAPTAVLAALTLAIGLAAGPLYRYSDRAAADLVDPAGYRAAVLGTAP